jgi:hypothetical protein
VKVTPRNEEIARPGFDETSWRAEILNLSRIRRSGNQDWISPRFDWTMDVSQQSHPISHRHGDILVRCHFKTWL